MGISRQDKQINIFTAMFILILILYSVFILAQSSCPPSWHLHVFSQSNKCYRYFAEKKTWEDSRTYRINIAEKEGNLASITDVGTNNFISGFSNTLMWIGGQKNSSQLDGFGWSDGTSWDFTSWNPSEPNNFAAACVEIAGGNEGKWNDGSCNNLRTFVCQQPSKEISVQDEKLLLTLSSWGPTFKISFELKILSFANCNPLGMANYLTFTATDNDCCDLGDRIPAFFTNSGGFLQLAMQINDNGNLVKSSPKLEENIWYNLEVEQFVENNKTFFLLRANGREVFRELQEKPKHFKNVKVYASKYAPANAVIRNLVY